MTTAIAHDERPGRLRVMFRATVKIVLCVFLSLTPVTAIVVLGWFTRKVARDVQLRLEVRKSAPWPNLFFGDDDNASSGWFISWAGGLYLNIKAGLRALVAMLAVTLPFSLLWMVGWYAGWENSFNKGYELSGIWPSITLAAVFLSLPMWALLPMAIVHQAVTARISAIFEVRQIMTLVRAAGWRYLALSLLIGFGGIGVLGVRTLPVFAEHISPTIASEVSGAIAEFEQQFRFGMTALLIVGLLVVRYAMASVYAHALKYRSNARSRLKPILMLVLVSVMWLGAVFLIFAGQFFNYAWFSWINQPVLMLPCLLV